jgi:hypothetical protein
MTLMGLEFHHGLVIPPLMALPLYKVFLPTTPNITMAPRLAILKAAFNQVHSHTTSVIMDRSTNSLIFGRIPRPWVGLKITPRQSGCANTALNPEVVREMRHESIITTDESVLQ